MERFFNRLGYVGGSLFFMGLIGTRFFFVVDGGERAVLFDKIRGVKPHVYGEGMHFLWPILQVSSSS
jgi:prohibitin 1